MRRPFGGWCTKLLDLLRKLGILRFGAETATYTNAADRPTSLQMDGVFDSHKDLVTSADMAARRGRLPSGSPTSPPETTEGRERRSS